MGSEVLLDILESVQMQIKEEPLEPVPVFSGDPLAMDFSPLVKMEISDDSLTFNEEEDVLGHSHDDPATESLGIPIAPQPPSLYSLLQRAAEPHRHL